MAWDTLQPTNTTKIRNLGVVIRPNWAAIQQADSTFTPDAFNFRDRTAAGLAVNPTAIPTAYIGFCKQDGAGNPELFTISPSSAVLQITQGSAMGSTSTPIKAQSISFDGTFLNTQNAFVTAWASVVVTGTSITSQTGYGITFARTAVGLYTATFTASQVTNANYAVIGNAYRLPSNQEGNLVSFNGGLPKTTTNFSIFITHTPSDTKRDVSFFVAVLGGR